VDASLELVKRGIVPDEARRIGPWRRSNDSRHRGDSVLLEWMRREPTGYEVGSLFTSLQQLREHRHDALWIVPGSHQHADRGGIGLELVMPAEAREQRSTTNVDRYARGVARADVRQPAHDRHTQVGLLCLLDLLGRMTQEDVSDLVAEHTRELGAGAGLLDEATVGNCQSRFRSSLLDASVVPRRVT
jgi:hypothetical protein